MTETYTTKNPTTGAIRKLDMDPIRLDADDELFYDLLKGKLGALLCKPTRESIDKITAYSKAWRTPLL